MWQVLLLLKFMCNIMRETGSMDSCCCSCCCSPFAVVGDGAVGKTCLLLTYTTGNMPGEYVPTIFDNYCANVFVDGKLGNLCIWDTAGQEDYDRLRPLSYPGTDIFFACYSSCNPSSLANLKHKWLREIRDYAGPNATVVLVGTKTDARDDPELVEKLKQRGMAPVSSEEGARFAEEMGCAGFVECSSRSGVGVKEVFDTAVRVGRVGVAAKLQAERRTKAGLFGRIKSLFKMRV